MQKITRQQHEAAKYSASRLKPLADAILAVNDQALGYNPEAIAKFNDFCDFISNEMMKAGAVIAQAQQQYLDRDQSLIGAASTRYFQIDNDIYLAKARQRDLAQTHKNKVEELTKKQFSADEIAKIVVDPSEEITALDTAIAALGIEKQKCQRFLADSPRFCEELLAGTSVFAVRDVQYALKGMVPKP